MKKYFFKIPQISAVLFCIALFFLQFPPLYLLPIFGPLSTTHSIVKYLSLFIFATALFRIYKNNQRLAIDKKLIFLILFYFLTQSFSVITSQNIQQFLLVYKNIIFGIIIFLISIIVVDKKNIKSIILIFFFTGGIQILFEFLIYFYPNFILPYIPILFGDNYWNFFNYQYQRQRFFGDVLVEIVVPYIFYFPTVKKNSFPRILLLIYIAAISFFSLVSNWRFKIVILVFTIFSSIYLNFRKIKKILIPLYSFILVFLIAAYFISIPIVGFNTLDRLLFREKEDFKSIATRFNFWRESIEIGLSSPAFGVGLGNYYEYLSSAEQLKNRNSILNLPQSFILIDDPHNIFISILASSGFLGLFSYIFLILYFIKSDLSSLKKSRLILKSTILVFWSFFLYALFNPAMEFSYQAMFWLLRGTIYKLDTT